MTNSKKISKKNLKYTQKQTITNRKNLLKNYSKKNIHNKNLHLHRGGALPPLISVPDYFQKQESAACGRHALNNLLGGEFFIKGIFNTDEKYEEAELNETGENLSSEAGKQFNLLKLCKYIAEKTAIVFTNPVNFCQANENYDTNVLELALQVCGFKTENRTSDLFIEEGDKTNLLGYIINYGGGHWVTLKYTPDKSPNDYTLVNSTSYRLDRSSGTNKYIPINLHFKNIDEYKTSMAKNRTNLVRTILVEKRDEQIKIDTIIPSIKNEIEENEKELEEKKKKLITEKKKLQTGTGTDALSDEFIKLIEYYYENNTDTDILNNIFDTDHTILKSLENKLIEIEKSESEKKISITAYDTFINLYNDLTNKPGNSVIIGLDYDGVLSLNVKPLLNSRYSRLDNTDNKLVGKKLELNKDFIELLKGLNNNDNNYILTKNQKLKYADLASEIQLIVNNDKLQIISGSKIDKLNEDKITHYFDDSNSNIFDIIKSPPTDLKKLYKVFPETIFDLYDNLNVKVDGTKNNSVEPKDIPLGTLNPKMVEIDNTEAQKIKILTYNINHKIKFNEDKGKLSKLIVELKKYMETDNVDFMCFQEFGFVDLTVDVVYKNGNPIIDKDPPNEQLKKYDEQTADKQDENNHPLNKINDLETDIQKKITIETLKKYKYVYNFQPKEHQFTFYDSTKYEIDKDGDKELIIRGNTDLRGGRPFTLIVFKKIASGEKLVLINVHFPHTKNKKIIKNNDMINNFIVSWINNIEYDSTKIEPLNPTKYDIPGKEFYSTTNDLVKKSVKEILLNTRIIVAGDFNRTVFSNSKNTSYYSNNQESGTEIDNSAYGLKLFKGLYDDSNKDKSIIMYNILPQGMDKFDQDTCSGRPIDNVLDSFGLQESYEYGEKSVSDHLPVLVTLLGAKPIYDLDKLKTVLQSGATSGIKVKVNINYCYD